MTAGTSTPLVLVGVGIVATGVAGAAGSAIALALLLEQKSTLLHNQAQLNEEVKLASGLQSSYNLLANSATQAALAAQQMGNAWGFLDGHLDTLITDVQKGQQNAGALRTMFLSAARGAVNNVQADINTITNQLNGIEIRSASSGTIQQQLHEIAKAA